MYLQPFTYAHTKSIQFSNTNNNSNNKDFISRGHSFENTIFHEGLQQLKAINKQTDKCMYKYTY